MIRENDLLISFFLKKKSYLRGFENCHIFKLVSNCMYFCCVLSWNSRQSLESNGTGASNINYIPWISLNSLNLRSSKTSAYG
jgi:hypothetical protein